MPSDVGIPIGQKTRSYVVMSRHFYNPTRKTGVVDKGTGYKVAYMPASNRNDLTQITLGTTQFVVPPMSLEYTFSSHCSPSCTRRLGPVQVTNVAFHMHGHGKRSRV